MLRPLRLVDQFNELERVQVEDWAELRLQLKLADESRGERAAALLAPANAGRFGPVIRFTVDRLGPAVGPAAARRLLGRLDHERIDGELDVLSVRAAPPEELRKKETLREQWDRQLTGLPPDWSDLYAEVGLDSTDYVERAALLMAPVNPSGGEDAADLRFRCARTFGYGVSAQMAGRCLDRCDEAGLTGELQILRALSDTHPVGTQGPVWLMGGRVV
jgi:hypothetical protein